MTNEEESYAKAVSILYKLSLSANSYTYSSYTTEKEFKSSYARISDIKFVEQVIPQHKGNNDGS
jgi:hypothetical protein